MQEQEGVPLVHKAATFGEVDTIVDLIEEMNNDPFLTNYVCKLNVINS